MPGRPIAPEDRADDYPRAVLFMILAAVFLPLLNAVVKYLSGRYPVLELLWARYAGHLASHGHFGVKFMITASWVSPLVAVRDPRSKPFA